MNGVDDDDGPAPVPPGASDVARRAAIIKAVFFTSPATRHPMSSSRRSRDGWLGSVPRWMPRSTCAVGKWSTSSRRLDSGRTVRVVLAWDD